MLAGELYRATDPELAASYFRAKRLTASFNALAADNVAGRRAALQELFATVGERTVVSSGLQCDYGWNVSIGRDTFVNHNCVLLDCNRIEIGDEVQIGPGVQIYTATHPLEAAARRRGLEYALPVIVEDGVWLGGGAIVCPGVRIGENTVVGAGSVVTRSLPPNVLAVGNPCRVVRMLSDEVKT
jgi:maltose O-acetyltransferase